MITNIEFATITWPVLLLIVVILAALSFGAFAGYFNSNIDAKKKLEEARARAEIAVQQARGEIERAAARIAQAEKLAASAPASSPPGKTILRLWLDSAERPALDLDGQSVDATRISEVHRKQLVSLLSVMRPWIEGKPITSAPISQPLAPAPQIVKLTPPPVKPPVKKDEKPAVPLSIVAQIDEILQAQLASTTLAGSGIRLQESPEGGVIVWVGLQKFAGVGDVTDPEVQSIIRAATAEWEKKYTPGL